MFRDVSRNPRVACQTVQASLHTGNVKVHEYRNKGLHKSGLFGRGACVEALWRKSIDFVVFGSHRTLAATQPWSQPRTSPSTKVLGVRVRIGQWSQPHQHTSASKCPKKEGIEPWRVHSFSTHVFSFVLMNNDNNNVVHLRLHLFHFNPIMPNEYFKHDFLSPLHCSHTYR